MCQALASPALTATLSRPDDATLRIEFGDGTVAADVSVTDSAHAAMVASKHLEAQGVIVDVR